MIITLTTHMFVYSCWDIHERKMWYIDGEVLHVSIVPCVQLIALKSITLSGALSWKHAVSVADELIWRWTSLHDMFIVGWWTSVHACARHQYTSQSHTGCCGWWHAGTEGFQKSSDGTSKSYTAPPQNSTYSVDLSKFNLAVMHCWQ
jgi:hypothetical protein